VKAEYCAGDVKACVLKFSLRYPGSRRTHFDVTVFLDTPFTTANYPYPSLATGFRMHAIACCIVEDIVGPVCPASTVVGSAYAMAMRTVRHALDALRTPPVAAVALTPPAAATRCPDTTALVNIIPCRVPTLTGEGNEDEDGEAEEEEDYLPLKKQKSE